MPVAPIEEMQNLSIVIGPSALSQVLSSNKFLR